MDKNTPEYHYLVLEVEPGASLEEIKRAYRDMAQVWHPDRFTNAPHLQRRALAKMKEINAAYEFLKAYSPARPRTSPPRPNEKTAGSASTAQSRRPGTERNSGRSTVSPDEVWRCKGHTATVSSVAFSPDGRTIASGSFDRTVRLWSARTGVEQNWLLGHEGAITSVAWSADSRRVLSGSVDRSMRLWDASNRREEQYFGSENVIRCVDLSADGTVAVSGSIEGIVQLWDVSTGRAVRKFASRGFINVVAFSSTGTHVASGNADGEILVFKNSQDYPVMDRHVSGNTNRQMVKSLVLRSNPGTLIASSAEEVVAWSRTDGRELYRFTFPVNQVTAACIGPDVRMVITGHADGRVRLWDLRTNGDHKTYRGHEAAVNGVAFSPDGRYAVSGSSDQTLRLWRIQ